DEGASAARCAAISLALTGLYARALDLGPSTLYIAYGFRDCEEITFNAEAGEGAEKKCLGISQRALRALRSNVVFFHRLFCRTDVDTPSVAILKCSHLDLKEHLCGHLRGAGGRLQEHRRPDETLIGGGS